MTSGILQQRPNLADELKATTQRFIELSKTAEMDSEDEEGGAGKIGFEATENNCSSEQQSSTGDLAILSARTMSTPVSRPQPETTIPPGYTHIGLGFCQNDGFSHEQPALANESNAKSNSDTTEYNPFTHYPSHPSTQDKSSRLSNSFSSDIALKRVHYEQSQQQKEQQGQWKVNVPNIPDYYFPTFGAKPTIPSYIVDKAPACLDITKGSNEPTFASRLIRISYTGGYNLLLQSYLHPNLTTSIFKFFLALHTRESIIEHMHGILTSDSLDCPKYWKIPFVNLGGAGTHYPLRDEQGHIIPRKNNLFVIPTGQGSLARLVMGDTNRDTGVIIDLTSYDNEEWLDANDVDCFLRERGIRIGPGDDHVTVDIPIWPSSAESSTPATMTSATTTSSSSALQTPRTSLSHGSSLVNSGDMMSTMDEHTYFPKTGNVFSRGNELLASPPETPPTDLLYCSGNAGNASSANNGIQSQSLSPSEVTLGNSLSPFAVPMYSTDPILNPAATYNGLLFPADENKRTSDSKLDFTQFMGRNVGTSTGANDLNLQQSSMNDVSILPPYEAALRFQPRQRVQIDVLEFIKGMWIQHFFFFFFFFFFPKKLRYAFHYL